MDRTLYIFFICTILLHPIAWCMPNLPVNFAFDIADYKYEETIRGKHFIDEQGTFLGLTGSYVIQHTKQYNQRVFVRAMLGNLIYNGGFYYTHSDGTTVTLPLIENGHKNYIFRIQDTIEYKIPHSVVTPFVGLGFRLLKDYPPKYSEYLYLRESHYLYLPIGLSIKPSSFKALSEIRVEAQYLLYGKQQSFLQTLETPAVNNQHNGFGLSADTTFRWKIDNKHMLFLTPYIQYWHILKSDLYKDSSVFEPNNFTTQAGLRLRYCS